MKQVALTGNAGSGKSSVAAIWREVGVPVVDADQLARAAVAPGTTGLSRVVEAFGDRFLADEGVLDRAALGRHVFADPAARQRLEAILHPAIAELREVEVARLAAAGSELIVSEIPLLFELGMEGGFDGVVLVEAPDELRRMRLVADRGLAPEEADALMDSQMKPASKRDRADWIISNDGTLEELERRSLSVLAEVRGRATDPTDGEAPSVLRIDMHLHTQGSYDCLSEPEAVLAAASARGVERIAITDHDRLEVAREYHARYPDRVIPGEEVRTAEGVDVIGLYVRDVIPRGTPAEEVCGRIRDQGGIVYLPHPYARGKGGGGRLAEQLAPMVDVVEAFNGRMHPAARNDPAERLAERFGKLRGAGSDAHTVREVGRCHVEVPRHDNSPAELLEALHSARIVGREASRLVHLASTWAKVYKRLHR